MGRRIGMSDFQEWNGSCLYEHLPSDYIEGDWVDTPESDMILRFKRIASMKYEIQLRGEVREIEVKGVLSD
tara:strand:+ start:141 stop:353 length:213 start_codon:yes stop_codon:yes gene_type:complete